MTQFSEILIPRKILRHNIRQFMRTRRRMLSIKQQAYFSQQATTRMITYPPVAMANTIALFLSFDGELDTKPLINKLWKFGKRIYLPALNPFGCDDLVFLHYHPKSKLVINRLNIYEPKFSIKNIFPLKQLDVLIIPLVAFDEKGQRLGMGGGFYDRTLRNWKKYGLPLVGYAYDCQIVKALPLEEWDIPLSAVVTPTKLWVW